jgi:hypothetical protein
MKSRKFLLECIIVHGRLRQHRQQPRRQKYALCMDHKRSITGVDN